MLLKIKIVFVFKKRKNNLKKNNLIEKNPITKLSASYNNKLITKIKDNFSETQQQLFVASFYCYLNCDQKNDFIIDLDNIWKWLEFSTKQKIILLLEKHFVLDKDYKSLLNLEVKQKKGIGKGGHNKHKYILNVKTFKSLKGLRPFKTPTKLILLILN